MTKQLSLTILLFALLTASISHRIFIEFSYTRQNQILFKYLHGMQNQYYVDIGAHNPVFLSNSIHLYADRWSGLNVDANPKVLQSFEAIRTHQTLLNIAVGDQNKFIDIYIGNEFDAMTTASKDVFDKFTQKFLKNITMSTITVPSISMQKLCESYFIKKPVFLNIDTAGYGSKALQGNNWQNQKCRPQLIMAQSVDQFNQAVGLRTPKQILQENDYKLIAKQQSKEVYVSKELESKYQKIAKNNEAKMKEMAIINFRTLNQKMKQHFKIQDLFMNNFDPVNSPMFVYYAPAGTPIYPHSIRQNMLKYNQQNENKSILILDFYKQNSSIIIHEDASYTESFISLDQNITFHRLNITTRHQSYEVLIFEHYNHGPPIKVQKLGDMQYFSKVTVILWIILVIVFIFYWIKYNKSQKQIKSMLQERNRSTELQL